MRWSRRAAGLALCAVLACNGGDEPTSPTRHGATQAVTCPPDWLCSTNGTIHDGTGSGTLVSVTGDPSPGADGVWLGNLRSEQWCYRTYNPFVTDNDFDWLDDECEFQLANAFAPALAIHPNDGCPLGEPYWAAKFFSNMHFGTGDMVRIAYMPSYYNDCGDLRPFGLAGPHEGDSEFIVLGIQYNLNTRHWEMKEIFLSAHHETFNSASIYTTDESILEYPVRRLAYPRVWIAQKKHANYIDHHDCETRAVFDDNCDGNNTVGRIEVYRNHNVGSRFVDFLPNGVASKNPTFSGNGRKEFFYKSQKFRGWQVTGEGAIPLLHVAHCRALRVLGPESDPRRHAVLWSGRRSGTRLHARTRSARRAGQRHRAAVVHLHELRDGWANTVSGGVVEEVRQRGHGREGGHLYRDLQRHRVHRRQLHHAGGPLSQLRPDTEGLGREQHVGHSDQEREPCELPPTAASRSGSAARPASTSRDPIPTRR